MEAYYGTANQAANTHRVLPKIRVSTRTTKASYHDKNFGTWLVAWSEHPHEPSPYWMLGGRRFLEVWQTFLKKTKKILKKDWGTTSLFAKYNDWGCEGPLTSNIRKTGVSFLGNQCDEETKQFVLWWNGSRRERFICSTYRDNLLFKFECAKKSHNFIALDYMRL